MSTSKLQTATLATGETVLAKSPTEPLRYANLFLAKRKLDIISPILAPARLASIVKQDGRFLIFIYDAPGYQTFSKSDVNRMLSEMPVTPKRTPFCTTSGQRQNPRSRHNHSHSTDKPYYFGR